MAGARSKGVSNASLREILIRGEVLRKEARQAEALALFRKAAHLAPNNPAPFSLLGVTLMDVGELEESEKHLRRAMKLAPNYPAFQHSLALNLLTQGRYREAWPLYEARSGKDAGKIGFPVDVPCPRWRGENLAGKHIVILPEQGFGDAIQFYRFLPRLLETGARITLFVQPALLDLFKTSLSRARHLSTIQLRMAAGEVRLGDPDFWTTLIDMMQPLGITLEHAKSPPYLFTDRIWPPLKDGFAIGLVTRGNPNHANDGRRSLDPAMAARLQAGLPGNIVSLDPNVSGARDFADTAALIKTLDLIVSVDTSVGHLAGALGKKCLVLIPGVGTDWRWLRNRKNTPWYANHLLFRGAGNGDWTEAVDAVIDEARKLESSSRQDS